MNRVGLFVLATGVSGLLAWIGVRASIWLSGELAYHRWRRQRVHTIILRRPEAGQAQHPAPDRAFVWDGRTGQAPE